MLLVGVGFSSSQQMPGVGSLSTDKLVSSPDTLYVEEAALTRLDEDLDKFEESFYEGDNAKPDLFAKQDMDSERRDLQATSGSTYN
jgi:hypothetical protein